MYIECGSLEWSEGTRSPGSGITGDCDVFNVGAGSQTHVFWESSKCSSSLSYLPSPSLCFKIKLENALAVGLGGLRNAECFVCAP